MKKRVIYIVGADHSGSTLMGCILGSEVQFGRVFHTGECYCRFTQGNRFFDHLTCTTCKQCRIWSSTDPNVGATGAHDEIFSAVGCEVIVDSSKNAKWVRESSKALMERGIEVSFLGTWKSPEKLVSSAKSRGVPHQLETYQRILREVPNIQFVNIEDIVANPATKTRQICDLLQIPYFQGKEEYWKYEHHHIGGARLQRQQIKGNLPVGYHSARNHPVDSQTLEIAAKFKFVFDRVLDRTV